MGSWGAYGLEGEGGVLPLPDVEGDDPIGRAGDVGLVDVWVPGVAAELGDVGDADDPLRSGEVLLSVPLLLSFVPLRLSG